MEGDESSETIGYGYGQAYNFSYVSAQGHAEQVVITCFNWE
jgi:hypothetical protein